jgi:hypothetical protein
MGGFNVLLRVFVEMALPKELNFIIQDLEASLILLIFDGVRS